MPSASKKESLDRDPKDGAFDLSGWLATRTGVLPVISPITEPTIGYVAHIGFWGGDRWRCTGAIGRVSPKFKVYGSGTAAPPRTP